MRILFNINLLTREQEMHFLPSFAEVIKAFAEQNNGVVIVILCREEHGALFRENENTVVVSKKPPAASPLLWKWWHRLKIPAVLKDHDIDVYVSCNGFGLLHSAVFQCFILPLRSQQLHRSKAGTFSRGHQAALLRRANLVLCESVLEKEQLQKELGLHRDKLALLPAAVTDADVGSEDSGEEVKNRYTEGKNFFLYISFSFSQDKLTTLLKAFSHFKKRQKSNWKLVLINRGPLPKNVISRLNTYKYRSDVIRINQPGMTTCRQLISAAYALLHPFIPFTPDRIVLEAMNGQTAVIAFDDPVTKEITQGAAVFTSGEEADLADKMMLLYKDEALRAKLIQKGREVVLNNHPAAIASLLWTLLTKAASDRATRT